MHKRVLYISLLSDKSLHIFKLLIWWILCDTMSDIEPLKYQRKSWNLQIRRYEVAAKICEIVN